MASVINVYDRFGMRLGEFYQDANREWLANEPGEVEFSLSIVEEKGRVGERDLGRMLAFRNLVEISHPTLPAWVGFICKYRWGKGVWTITARGGEGLLKLATPTEVIKINGTSGGMFEKILEVANAQLDTKFEIGDIFRGGSAREETLEMNDLLAETQRVAERCGNDFDVQPRVRADNRLELEANWYERRGDDLEMRLIEGHNISLPGGDVLVQDGEGIFSHVIGISNGATNAARSTVVVSDAECEGRYGRAYMSEVFDNVTEGDTLRKNANGKLNEVRNPTSMLSILVNASAFWGVRLGNTLPVILYEHGLRADGTFGFEERCRVVGMRYRERENYVEAVMEVV